MSNTIFGNLPNNVQIINNDIRIEHVPVNIPSYKNRKTNAQTIKKYLKARGGMFDRRIWQEPLVAELPDGTRYLFDGDHRRTLYRMAYPDKETMPVQVVSVESKQEISRLFVNINKTGRKSLTKNEVFVHEFLGGNEEAIKTGKILNECGLQVSLGTDEEGTYVGNKLGPQVQIEGFRKAVNQAGANAVKVSSAMIKLIWPQQQNIGVEMLTGFALLEHRTPLFERHQELFVDFLKACKVSDITSVRVSTTLKKEGGDKLNRNAESIALGTLLKLKDWAADSKRLSKKTFTKYYGSYLDELNSSLNK